MISSYDQYKSKCIFVLTPEKIISKYVDQKDPMDYTDFANNETRLGEEKLDNFKYHAKELIKELKRFTK